jgi:hypothetical protein
VLSRCVLIDTSTPALGRQRRGVDEGDLLLDDVANTPLRAASCSTDTSSSAISPRHLDLDAGGHGRRPAR